MLKSIYISKIGLVVPLFTSESLMYQCFQGFPYVAHLLAGKNPVFGPYVAMLLISLCLGEIAGRGRLQGDRRGHPDCVPGSSITKGLSRRMSTEMANTILSHARRMEWMTS